MRVVTDNARPPAPRTRRHTHLTGRIRRRAPPFARIGRRTRLLLRWRARRRRLLLARRRGSLSFAVQHITHAWPSRAAPVSTAWRAQRADTAVDCGCSEQRIFFARSAARPQCTRYGRAAEQNGGGALRRGQGAGRLDVAGARGRWRQQWGGRGGGCDGGSCPRVAGTIGRDRGHARGHGANRGRSRPGCPGLGARGAAGKPHWPLAVNARFPCSLASMRCWEPPSLGDWAPCGSC